MKTADNVVCKSLGCGLVATLEIPDTPVNIHAGDYDRTKLTLFREDACEEQGYIPAASVALFGKEQIRKLIGFLNDYSEKMR